MLPQPPTYIFGDAVYANAMKLLEVDLLETLESALAQVTGKTSLTLVAFAHAVINGVGNIGAEIESVNRVLVRLAQEAIVSAYMEGLLGSPSYRTEPLHERNRRYSGGILLALLQSDQMVESNAHGFSIGNDTMLDDGARQWRRLNYGAGAAAGGGPERFAVRWSNVNLSLEEPGEARPSFMLPPGRWFGAEFYPMGELTDEMRATQVRRFGRTKPSRWKPTRGIRGTHFMGAGLRVVADQMGPMYNEVFKKIWANAEAAARAALTQDVGLKRPGTWSSSSRQV